MTTRVGLIVNPIAGIGGRVGLKGGDGLEVQQRARELGAVPASLDPAVQALKRLAPL
jgi:predicted polyphosphate/ATP-dependent NAD kinase